MALPNTTGYFDLVAKLNAGGALPSATTTTTGAVKQAAFVAAAAVPFADLTAAANAFNALRTALINAGVLAAS